MNSVCIILLAKEELADRAMPDNSSSSPECLTICFGEIAPQLSNLLLKMMINGFHLTAYSNLNKSAIARPSIY